MQRSAAQAYSTDIIRRLACALVVLILLGGLALPVGAASVRVIARQVQPGELIILRITNDAPLAGVTLRAFDREWQAYRVDDRTWEALVGIDLDVAPGPYALRLSVEQPGAPPEALTHTVTVVSREFRTRRLTVSEDYVDPPAPVLERILREAERLNALWDTRTPERLWQGAFVRPVPQEANSAFGTRTILNGQARSPHSGADFASPTGTPIKSPNGGRVVLAEDLYYTGGTVIIDHGLGLYSVFAHLSAIETAEGTTVMAGEVVGRTGSTGRVTGPHLHWTVRAGGARVDPLSLLAVTSDPR